MINHLPVALSRTLEESTDRNQDLESQLMKGAVVNDDGTACEQENHGIEDPRMLAVSNHSDQDLERNSTKDTAVDESDADSKAKSCCLVAFHWTFIGVLAFFNVVFVTGIIDIHFNALPLLSNSDAAKMSVDDSALLEECIKYHETLFDLLMLCEVAILPFSLVAIPFSVLCLRGKRFENPWIEVGIILGASLFYFIIMQLLIRGGKTGAAFREYSDDHFSRMEAFLSKVHKD